MVVSTINQELSTVYQEYLTFLYQPEKLWHKDMSSPLLMHVFDEYVTVSKKIMFVGQETHRWAGLMNDRKDLDELLSIYKQFEIGNAYKGKHGNRKPHALNSPFWNFNRAFFRAVNKNVERRNKGFLWSNISKFDIAGTTPGTEHIETHPEGFALLIQEISIAKPDIVVFYTGKKYQKYLNDKISLEEADWQQVGDESLPLKTLICAVGDHQCRLFRTEHPNHLYRGWPRTGMNQRVLEQMVKLVNSPS